MALSIILGLYGIILAIWLLCSLIIVFYLLKYQPISLSGWLAIAVYFLIASSLLLWTWNNLLPLIDLDSLSLPFIQNPY